MLLRQRAHPIYKEKINQPMQALIIKSSPNMEGNTANLVKNLVRGLKENNVQVTEFNINDMDIQYCKGCNVCLESLEPECVIRDDMHQIYEAYMSSKLIVYATPIWWWHMNAQMKTVIDRHHALLYKDEYTENLKGKKVILVVSFLHDDQDGVYLVERMFKSITDWSESSLSILRHHCVDGHVKDNYEKMLEAYELGVKLTELL
jgi:multimeric flavodoxin WrbA